MRTAVRRIAMILLLAAFLVSAGTVTYVKRQYRESAQRYELASQRYTLPAAPLSAGSPSNTAEQPPEGTAENDLPLEYAPIAVDFDALRAVNPDIVGWIYCEDSVINYPVLQAADNDYYLHRSYDRSNQFSGSIFVDAANRPGFVDCNTILYGHHMNDGSMFASLDLWADQSYYEAHPVLWLLTPEQDYKLVLFSGYTTSAFSDIYTVRPEPDAGWQEYLEDLVRQSDFQADVDLSGCERTVMLSTCAYVFDFARHVLHAALIPVEHAGSDPS